MRPASIRAWESTVVVATLPSPPPALSAAAGSALAAPRSSLLAAGLRWAGRGLSVACAAAVVFVIALGIAPHVLPIQTFAVVSGSMQPTIPVGAIVVGTPVPADRLRVDDIITFQNPNHTDRLVTHRIRQIADSAAGPLLETQGDANPAPDPWVLQASKQPVHRYLFQVPFLGYVILASQTIAVRIGIAVAGALAFWLLWWRQEDGREDAQEDGRER